MITQEQRRKCLRPQDAANANEKSCMLRRTPGTAAAVTPSTNKSTIPKAGHAQPPKLIQYHSLYKFRTFVKAMPEQKTKAPQDDTAIVCLRRLTAPLRLRPDRMRSMTQMQQAVSIPLMARHAVVFVKPNLRTAAIECWKVCILMQNCVSINPENNRERPCDRSHLLAKARGH